MNDLRNNLVKNEVNDRKIEMVRENFQNITTGMDVFLIDTDKIVVAPAEWNFYKKLDDSKMVELIESILDNGLLNAVIIWEQGNGKYMMLSGHNRLRAYQMIYEQTKNDEYKRIHVYIKKKDELTEEEARTIIIDTNFVQRQLSTLEKAKSIVYKYNTLGRKKYGSREKSPTEKIAEDYNMTNRQVFKYIKLQYLLPEIMQLIDNGVLNINSGVKLAGLNKDIQERLYQNELPFLNNKSLRNIESTDYEEILTQIKNGVNEHKLFKIKIPDALAQNFKEYLLEWKHYTNISIEQ